MNSATGERRRQTALVTSWCLFDLFFIAGSITFLIQLPSMLRILCISGAVASGAVAWLEAERLASDGPTPSVVYRAARQAGRSVWPAATLDICAAVTAVVTVSLLIW